MVWIVYCFLLFKIALVACMDKSGSQPSLFQGGSFFLPSGEAVRIKSQEQHMSQRQRIFSAHSQRISQKGSSQLEGSGIVMRAQKQAVPQAVPDDPVELACGLHEMYKEFVARANLPEPMEQVRAQYLSRIQSCRSLQDLVRLHSEIIDWNRNTLLLYAVIDKDSTTIAWLCKGGVDVNVKNADNETPLHRAEDLATAQLLVQAGAIINVRDTLGGQTPLLEAVRTNNRELVAFLCARGADCSIKNNNGWTPLFCACVGTSDDEIVRMLCEVAPHTVDMANNEGRTPLFPAACDSHTLKIDYLLRAGASVGIRDHEKKTALFAALEGSCNYDVVERLCRAQIPIDAATVSRARQYEEVYQYLRVKYREQHGGEKYDSSSSSS